MKKRVTLKLIICTVSPALLLVAIMVADDWDPHAFCAGIFIGLCIGTVWAIENIKAREWFGVSVGAGFTAGVGAAHLLEKQGAYEDVLWSVFFILLVIGAIVGSVAALYVAGVFDSE